MVLCSKFAQDSIQNMQICSFVIFLLRVCQRPMTDRKIEWSDGHSFGPQQLLADSIENFILYE